MTFLTGGLDAITSFFSGIQDLTSLYFWERAGTLVLGAALFIGGLFLLFRRPIPEVSV